jgi:hypothetical protein
MPIILATQEAEISYHEKPFTKKKRAGGVAQGEGPEFKPSTANKTKQKEKYFPEGLLLKILILVSQCCWLQEFSLVLRRITSLNAHIVPSRK